MGNKQIKIALSDEFYNLLATEAKKQKLPISSYARSLMSSQLDVSPKAPVSTEKKVSAPEEVKNKDDEELIFLSDVLQDEKKASDGPDNSKSSTGKITKGDKAVNIQITVN